MDTSTRKINLMKLQSAWREQHHPYYIGHLLNRELHKDRVTSQMEKNATILGSSRFCFGRNTNRKHHLEGCCVELELCSRDWSISLTLPSKCFIVWHHLKFATGLQSQIPLLREI
jgi:hypothetical protein